MEMIKSYTDIEQSRKLAEILSADSADMRIGNYVGKFGKVDGTNVHYYPKGESFGAPEIISAWSLAALLEQIAKHGILDLYFLHSTFDNKGNHLTNVWNLMFDDIGNVSLNIYADNPVDACYALILKLHELKML